MIAATPHSPGSSACRLYDPATIHARVTAINTALSREGLPIEVVAGTEIFYTPSIIERLQRGELLAYGRSRAVLLELNAAQHRPRSTMPCSTCRWPATGSCWRTPSGSPRCSSAPSGWCR
ncbi:MAG: CpsB/CapC family capsule biosynthesis tyrosine phosphatase [Kouleothrix sp.]